MMAPSCVVACEAYTDSDSFADSDDDFSDGEFFVPFDASMAERLLLEKWKRFESCIEKGEETLENGRVAKIFLIY